MCRGASLVDLERPSIRERDRDDLLLELAAVDRGDRAHGRLDE